MANYAEHFCKTYDEIGRPTPPKMVTCATCWRAWCERCDPAPAALCPFCHGYGFSTAPIPPRQARTLRWRI